MDEAEARDIETTRGLGLPKEERNRLNIVIGIFTRLSIACKSRVLYPVDHPASREAVDVLYSVMTNALADIPSITVRVVKDNLVFGGLPIGQEREGLRQLASRIRSLRIQEVTFAANLTQLEVEALVDLLASDPEDLEIEGGAETLLVTRGVRNISVVESVAQLANEEARDENKDPSISSILEAAVEHEPPEVEVSEEDKDFLELLLNPEELARTLSLLGGEGASVKNREELANAIFQFLKDSYSRVEEIYPGLTQSCLRSMAESLLFLETKLRNLLLLRHLFPRISDEPVCAGILGQFNAREMADILGHFLSTAKALIPRIGTLLRTAGFEDRGIEQTIDLLKDRLIDMGEVPPSLISILGRGLGKEDVEAAEANELPTLDKISTSFNEYGPEEIQEIHRISEFDLATEMLLETTPMLLDLLSRGAKLDNMDRAVKLLQQNFWDIATSERFALTETILERIMSVLENDDPAIDPIRSDLNRLVQDATGDKVIRGLVPLAYERRYDTESEKAFKRYLSGLGERGIMALTEGLGEEEDMSVRKYLVDILAELCKNQVQILGTYVNDPRWFLVRNIVNIMARIHTQDTLPYLRLTSIHPNPKVRAETIRALGLTGGYEAANIMINSLQSMEETTRIACIRWLGRLEEPRAVNRMVNMLEDKEAGGESLRIKKEIIISLGEISAPETYEVLKKYRTRRKLLNRSAWRDINTAAEESLDQLLEKYPHLGRKL